MIVRPAGFALLYLVLASAAHGQDGGEVLFHVPETTPLSDSKYGPIGDFQRGLLAAAKRCGISIARPESFADGVFGTGSTDVVRRVAACRRLVLNDPTGRTLTPDLWKTLVDDVPVPTARQRAR
jgi:hypothetical protein